MSALTLNLRPTMTLTNKQFAKLCQANPELRLERTATGELVIMPPTGGEAGRANAELVFQLSLWNHHERLGIVFDSSTGFRLSSGAIRSPDTAWIRQARWQALTPAQRRGFIPLCPDFLMELRSPTDDWEELQAKMHEYLANGLRLGWLIDPEIGQVEIVRSGQPAELQRNPETLSGESVLPGFVLDLKEILAK
jgi:Uma2 family endonuclease